MTELGPASLPPTDLDERRKRRERRAKAETTQARLIIATVLVVFLALVSGHYTFASEALLVGFVGYVWIGRGKR